MRHLKKRKKLNLEYDHRHSLIKNLVRALFSHGKIRITLPKAKLTGRLVERLVSNVKKDGFNGRRMLFSLFNDQNYANQIADQMITRFKNREGGITRIRKVKRRKGDNAILSILEFVDGEGGVIKKGIKEGIKDKKVVKKQ